jgi:molecular chaperone HscA
MEAHRIGTSTKKSIDGDAELLVEGERERIVAALAALDDAAKGADPRKIQLRIDDLDAATKDFAGRRMNRAIAKAIEGQRLDAVERTVEHAKGIELAHGSPLPAPPPSR